MGKKGEMKKDQKFGRNLRIFISTQTNQNIGYVFSSEMKALPWSDETTKHCHIVSGKCDKISVTQ